MEENKPKRGGARPGAGRKKIEGRDIAVTFRISSLAKQRLTDYAQRHGISLQEAVNRMFESL